MQNEVNLIPQKETDYKKSFQIILIVFSIFGFLICGGGWSLLYFYNQGLDKQIVQENKKIDQITADINASMEGDILSKSERLQKQSEYMIGILDQHILNSKAIDSFLSLIMPEVSFSNFSLSFKDAKASLEISAPSYNLIAQQIEKIRQSSLVKDINFTEVSFDSSTTGSEGGQMRAVTDIEVSLNKKAWGVEDVVEENTEPVN